MMFNSRNLVQLSSRFTQKARTSSAIVSFPRRYEGTYPWWSNNATKLPKENPNLADTECLDETEVQTRMS